MSSFFLNYLCKQICSPWARAKSQVHSNDFFFKLQILLKMWLWTWDWLLRTRLPLLSYAFWLLLSTSDTNFLFSMCLCFNYSQKDTHLRFQKVLPRARVEILFVMSKHASCWDTKQIYQYRIHKSAAMNSIWLYWTVSKEQIGNLINILIFPR